MLNKKYNKTLTIVLIIMVIVVAIVLGFWGYNIYQRYYAQKDASQAIEEWDNQTKGTVKRIVNNVNIAINEVEITSNEGSAVRASLTYKGFTMLGYIEIPKISVKLPILARTSERALNTSVCYHFGPGLNQVGNTVIFGHNYRDGSFFSNLGKVENNDSIFITDETGKRLEYKVYNTYQTTAEDAEYFYRDTAGKREISLSTCTDDVQSRTIVWAKETE